VRFLALTLLLPFLLFVVVPWNASADHTGWNRVRLICVVALNLSLVVLVVVPWQRFDPVPHWERIQWIPLVSPPITLRDLLGNVALYVPLGHALARLAGIRRGMLLGVGTSLLIAVCTESLQLFSRGRYPSTTDLLSNTTGAWLGVTLALWLMRRARPTA
jgi:glycopeptide antibiotics resistance protein